MVEAHERLTRPLPQRRDVTPDRVVAPGVPVLGLQPLVNTRGVVTLLPRCRFVVTQNLIDHRDERTQLRITDRSAPRVRQRLTRPRTDRPTHRLLTMTQPPSNRTHRFARRVSLPNLKIIQHRKHPRFVRVRPHNATRPTNLLSSAGIFRAPHPAPVREFSAPLPMSCSSTKSCHRVARRCRSWLWVELSCFIAG